jgi:predicted 3-demethylubiquinone-9 3-methyltransferase (glyoxalase superfamily)
MEKDMEKGKRPRIAEKRMQALSLDLTADQKAAIEEFWKKTGSIGGVEIQVAVVNDKISPASIQVGTAK